MENEDLLPYLSQVVATVVNGVTILEGQLTNSHATVAAEYAFKANHLSCLPSDKKAAAATSAADEKAVVAAASSAPLPIVLREEPWARVIINDQTRTHMEGRQISVHERVLSFINDKGKPTKLSSWAEVAIDPLPTHRFLLAPGQTINVKMEFHDGLVVNVRSRVAQSDSKGYQIVQALSVKNPLPFNLEQLADLKVSFQNRDSAPSRRGGVAPAMAASMGAMSSLPPMSDGSMADEAQSALADISSLTSLGPISADTVKKLSGKNGLPGQGCTVTFPEKAAVPVKIQNVYEDIQLDYNNKPTFTTVFEMVKGGSDILLPSMVDLIDAKTGSPVAQVAIPLRKNDAPFEVTVGHRSVVSVTKISIEKVKPFDQQQKSTKAAAKAAKPGKDEKDHTETHAAAAAAVDDVPYPRYSITLKSHTNEKLQIRIRGYQLGPQVDNCTLAPNEERDFIFHLHSTDRD
jgi:hypothetical protein